MNDLLKGILAAVGPKGLLMGEELSARASSSTDATPHKAIALVRPKNTQELSAVMALCNAQSQPVAVQGGLTGLVDGATANDDELAISLERMKGVEAIDAHSKTATVAAGTPIQTLQDKAAQVGLLFAVDWGARGSAMVGGGISTNAGGNSVLRYGMMRDQVLGLEVVLADGTILSSMNRLLKNNTGYDLKQLFIGSEGTLGIVTRAVLKLHTAPKDAQTALLAVDNFDQLIKLLSVVDSGLSGSLSAFEVMWQDHYELVVNEGGHAWVLPQGLPYYVIIESTGSSPQADMARFEEVLGQAMEQVNVLDAVLCTSSAQREAVWAIREDVDAFLRALDPAINFDISMPIGDMGDYVKNVRADIAKQLPNARGTAFGHVGDGNLHMCWTVGSDDSKLKSQLSNIVYRNLQGLHGSVSAEHGIGRAKRKYLQLSRTNEELCWMKNLKQLFDPKNILNPGRVVMVDEEIDQSRQ